MELISTGSEYMFGCWCMAGRRIFLSFFSSYDRGYRPISIYGVV